MAYADIAIVVVDDARFSSAMIDKVIRNAGYTDVRHASSARDALALLEQRPASVLLADWVMPEMDGLALTRRVRQLDEASNRYTYIILLTANDGVEEVGQAFDEGVDDFVGKAEMSRQLVPRILAAERIVTLHNRVLAENQMLLESNNRLREQSLIDLLTGLGNQRYALKAISETLNHTASRGGATCCILIRIDNLDTLSAKHPQRVTNQLVVGVGRRIRQLVRPLDRVSRISDDTFAIVSHTADIATCNASTFKRLHQGINLKAYKTDVDFISVQGGVSLVAADNQTGIPKPEELLERASGLLDASVGSGLVSAARWHAGD